MEIKICKKCEKEFTVEPIHFEFYEKIKVPPPTFCPDCRQQRRYAWRNERVLYRRNCDLCGKSTVTIYSTNKPYKVYCSSCWWGDGWDPGEYGRDFDFSRPFFEQWHELHLAVPRMPLLVKNSVNSEYTNHANGNKNCYLVFGTFNCENVLYSNRVLPGKDCMDCHNLAGKGTCELCYELTFSEKCYQCQYGYLLKDCTDCLYCIDCRGCSNCLFSYNLRNKQYYIENKQYTKEDYFSYLKQLSLENYDSRKKAYDTYLSNFKKAVFRPAVTEQTINATGNFLFYVKNAEKNFSVENAENTIYCINGSLGAKDCMDCYNFGAKCELVYETHAHVGSYNSCFCHLCYDNNFITYCDSCQNSNNLFGCVCVKKGAYRILNKQYTKEEYENLVPKIIEHMKKTGEYGEFFPASMSPFGYNETQGMIHMPLLKEDALRRGFKWEDNMPGTYGKETLTSENLPQSISETPDSITKEVLVCIKCTKNYNIVSPELELSRRIGVPIPRLCFDCRYRRRLSLIPSRHLHKGECMCEKVGHEHKGKCSNVFVTPYGSDRPETVYCEGCYQKEVI